VICHCLGSFIFQTRKPEGSYTESVWESVIIELHCGNGTVREDRIIPIVLDGTRMFPQDECVSGLPRFADAFDSRRIAQSMRTRSAALGTTLREQNGILLV
jgi:poly-gamma-glutamate capsule biosynthesis protein CapA/YwtB (metallophosphatase superfamily)